MSPMVTAAGVVEEELAAAVAAAPCRCGTRLMARAAVAAVVSLTGFTDIALDALYLRTGDGMAGGRRRRESGVVQRGLVVRDTWQCAGGA